MRLCQKKPENRRVERQSRSSRVATHAASMSEPKERSRKPDARRMTARRERRISISTGIALSATLSSGSREPMASTIVERDSSTPLRSSVCARATERRITAATSIAAALSDALTQHLQDEGGGAAPEMLVHKEGPEDLRAEVADHARDCNARAHAA